MKFFVPAATVQEILHDGSAGFRWPLDAHRQQWGVDYYSARYCTGRGWQGTHSLYSMRVILYLIIPEKRTVLIGVGCNVAD